MTLNRFRPKKSAERVAKAKQLRAAGKSWNEISGVLGVSPQTAHAWCDENYNIKRIETKAVRAEPPREPIKRPQPGEKLDPMIEYQVLDLKRRGYRAQAIAAVLHVPYRVVEEALR